MFVKNFGLVVVVVFGVMLVVLSRKLWLLLREELINMFNTVIYLLD